MQDNPYNIDLPKWPAMFVCGKSVTEKEAAEVLIRTDFNFPDFNSSCNDREYIEELNWIFKVPESPRLDDRSDTGKEKWHTALNKHYAALSKLREKYKMLDLEYISNHQIASCYIGGTYGWIDWEGNISSNSTNIGKWPSVKVVHEEWAQLAKAFPFLDLRCVLFGGEYCEDAIEPLVKFDIKDGEATCSSDVEDVKDAIGKNLISIGNSINFFSRSEQGIWPDTLEEKIIEIYGDVYKFSEDE